MWPSHVFAKQEIGFSNYKYNWVVQKAGRGISRRVQQFEVRELKTPEEKSFRKSDNNSTSHYDYWFWQDWWVTQDIEHWTEYKTT